MTVTVSKFRTDLPEFEDALRYTDGLINFWMAAALLRLPADRWDDLLDHGVELFTAHQIALSARAQDAAASGGIPGSGAGVVASKAVDKVSVSYDTGAATLEAGGHWNLTTYGIQFLQLARMVGSGGIQL